ncbi:MAG: prepilin-type N-terminal cleavage/methylation domain-containing protein [Planctomycetota bacterium]
MKHRAFSLVELLVVIAVIALLVAVLLPVLGKARSAARTAACLSQSRQIATAVAAFAADNRGRFPENRTLVGDKAGDEPSSQYETWRWRFLQAGYIQPPEAWVCPAHPGEPLSELDFPDRGSQCVGDTPSSYALNGHVLWRDSTLDEAAVRSDTSILRPSHTILIAESRVHYPDIRITNALVALDMPDGGGVFGYWHAGDGVYSFQDGHAETINLMDTGAPDCRWHNGRDNDDDFFDTQTRDEIGIHDHPDWVYLANPVYLRAD